MPYATLDILRVLPAGLALQAVVATLPHAGSEERDALVTGLLGAGGAARQGAVAVLPLVRWWKELGDSARAAIIVAAGGDMPLVVASLRASTVDRDRQAAAMLIAHVVRNNQSVARGWDADLAWAAENYPEHRIAEVLSVAAMRAGEAGAGLRAFLADPRQASHMALRSAARSLPVEAQRSLLVAWLAVPALEAVARDRLERGSDAADLAAIFERAHLLRARQRGTALRRIERAERLLACDACAWLAAPLRRGRVAVIAELALPESARVAHLHAALSDPDTHVRAASVLALRRLPASPLGDEALADYALDADCGPASVAAAALVTAATASRRRALLPSYQRLARSPHAPVRALARRAYAAERAAGGIACDRLASPVAARVRLTRDRAGLLAALRTNIDSTRIDEVLGAITLAQRLGVVADLRADLLRLAHGADARAASKALSALSCDSSPETLTAIRSCLSHADGRVRASALEAMSHREPGDAVFESLMHDDTPRVRAVAIWHLLRRDGSGFPASHALMEMLGDARPSHRVSALWVVERLRCVDVSQRVADLAARDESTLVRERAARCATLLAAAIRLGWSRRLAESTSSETSADITVLARSRAAARGAHREVAA